MRLIKYSSYVISFILIILLSFSARADNFTLKNNISFESQEKISVLDHYAISKSIGTDKKKYHGITEGQKIVLENNTNSLIAKFSNNERLISIRGYEFSLLFNGYGYEGDSLINIDNTTPEFHENIVQYTHGPLVEWYVNGPYGLQQGFTVLSPPKVHDEHSNNLLICLALKGDMKAVPSSNAEGISFLSPSGQEILNFEGLVAVDASGKELPVRLTVSNNQLTYSVNDEDALYPVIVDPIFKKSKLFPNSGEVDPSSDFGYSIGMSGDTIVAADERVDGESWVVYVFQKPATGWQSMTETAKLTPSDYSSAESVFRLRVDISGDTIVASVSLFIQNGSIGTFSRGLVYLYQKPSTGWRSMTETAQLTMSRDITPDDVSIDANTVVTSTIGDIFVYEKPESGWRSMTETAILSCEGMTTDSILCSTGDSADVSGDTIVAGGEIIFGPNGQYFKDVVGYLFKKPTTGWKNMTQTSVLKSRVDNYCEGGVCSFSVAVRDDTVTIGAAHRSTDTGVVYLYEKPSSGWPETMYETAELSGSDAGIYSRFGVFVDTNGDRVVAASAPYSYTSALYIFEKPKSGWQDIHEATKLIPYDGQYGICTTPKIDGNVIVTGSAWVDSLNEETAHKVAYVYEQVETTNLNWMMLLLRPKSNQ